MVKEYIVFSQKPHYFAAVMSCIYCQLQRKDVPLDKLITGHVSFRRRAWASCAPYSWASQKAILSVSKSYWKTIQMTVMNRVNVSADKEPNDIFSSWFGILSRLLLSSAGGTSKIVR